MNQENRHRDEIDLVDYIRVVYKYRWLIVLIVLVSMFFAGITSLMKTKIYEAQATFFPMNTDYSIQSQGVVMEPRLDIEDLIISILESRKMADRIIEQLDLKKIWNEKLLTHTRKRLDTSTKINFDKNGIIKLSVMTESPKLSADIANAYVDNLDYFNVELDIGAKRKIVQLIDRAAMPEEKMPRGTVKKTIVTGLISLLLAIFLSFLLEFINRSDINKRLKEI